MIISEYYSEDGSKRAVIKKETDGFVVTMTTKTGTTTKKFISENQAEIYAEDFVMEYKNYKFWGE